MASSEQFSEQSLSRDFSLFLPFLLGLTAGIADERAGSDQAPPRHRVILIDPVTQTMTVIEGDLDPMLQDLARKDGHPPASKASIQALETVEIEEEGSECSICLAEYEEGESVKEMPCKHRFHGGCVEKWLGIHGTCPVCRYKMPVEEVGDLKKEEEGRSRGTREIWVTLSMNSDRRSSENRTDSDSDSADSSSS